jgi:hypothetical protein
VIAAGVEEDMTDAPALADVDDVAADWLEPEHALVKLACLVEVKTARYARSPCAPPRYLLRALQLSTQSGVRGPAGREFNRFD